MLAKGRLLGVQFDAFLEDDLWLTIARHANEMAARLAAAIREKGYPFYAESCTNQLFPILPDGKVDELRQSFDFDFIAKTDETHTAVRFVTSWATSAENVDRLIAAL